MRTYEARFVGSDRAFIFFRLIFIAGNLIFDDFAYSNRKPLEAGAGNQYNGNQGKDDEFDDFIKKRLCS